MVPDEPLDAPDPAEVAPTRPDLPPLGDPAPWPSPASAAPPGPGYPAAPPTVPLGPPTTWSAPGPPMAPPPVGPGPFGPAPFATSPPALVPPGPSTAGPAPVGVGALPSSGRPIGIGRAILVAVVAAVVSSMVTAAMFLAFDDDRLDTASGPSSGSPTTALGNPPPGALDIQALLTKAQPSVVSIHVGQDDAGVFGAAGSGVIVDEEGAVLTNAHVIQGETDLEVTLFDGSRLDAELVGSLPDNDVALIRIKEPQQLVPAELGSAEAARVGDPVVAIGNALNLGGPPSVTQGIVSAKDRTIPVPGGRLEHLVQTDAAINPGNSGGPLLNAAGQVIGINTAIISDAQNIGFAISIDEIKPLLEQLKSGRGTVTPDTAFLGVSTEAVDDLNPEVAREYGVEGDRGAFVTDVVRGSAADEAGLRPGDLITKVDGTTIEQPADVGSIVRSKQPGDEITIEYRRAGSTRTTTATLKTRRESGN